MSISLRCPGCDTSHRVKNVLAGKRVRCKCGKELQLPVAAGGQVTKPARTPAATSQSAAIAQSTQTVSVRCRECGKTYRANATLAGKKVRCKCGAVVQVPTATPEPLASPLGDFLDDALNEPIAPAASPQVTIPREDMEQSPKPRRRKKNSEFDMDVLTTVTAVLCIIHGLARIGSFYYMPRFILSGHASSLTGLLSVCSFVVTVGIAAAGVGLLTKQTWALPIGSSAAVAYFALLAISMVKLLVTMMQNGSGLGLGIFVFMIPRIIAESITPGLLLHLNQRDRG